MKKKIKIKNLILTFIICIFGAFTFNSIKTSATNFEFSDGALSDFTYNEGVSYSNYSGNSRSYLTITRNTSNLYFTFIVESPTYTYVFNKCVLGTTTTSDIPFTCELQNAINKNKTTWDTLSGYNFNINKSSNKFSVYNSSQTWLFQIPTISGGYTEEDLQNSYDEGFRVGENAGLQQGYENGYSNGYNLGNQQGYELGLKEGNNPIALFDSCIIISLNGVNNGNTCNTLSSNPYDEYNNIVDINNLNNELMFDNDIVLEFTISRFVNPGITFMMYTAENNGAYIELYNNDVLVSIINTDSTNINDTYVFKSFDSSTIINKVRVYYDNYNTHVKQFGFYSTSQINPIKNHYEFVGYKHGYVQGNESGNNLMGMVATVMQQPVNMLITIFDFEFLGINLASFLFSLVTLLVVIWLVKKFI